MTAKDLKNALLQEAVQGKLVPQIASEGNVKDLLEEIRKARHPELVSGSKGKKMLKQIQHDNPITEDEIPFDIPENWCWCRLGEICSFENGDRSSNYPVETDYVSDGIPFFGAADMQFNKLDFSKDLRYISKEKFDSLRSGKLINNDFVLLLRGAVGKWAQFNETEKYKTGFINAQMVIIRTSEQFCDYVKLIFLTPIFASLVKSKTTGTAVAQMSAKDLAQLVIPLPPLTEQKRIVAAVELFMPLIEEYSKKEAELTALNAGIAKTLKNAILQEAVQGKLALQIASEGNAKDLLEEIKKSRHPELVSGSKGKKMLKQVQHDNPITDDEIPFDIPENWCWCRLGEIYQITMGQSPEGENVGEMIKGMEFHQGKIFFTDKWISKSNQQTCEITKVAEPNTILLCMRAPVGKVNLTDREICIGRGLSSIKPLKNISIEWAYYLFETLENDFVANSTGSTFKAITGDIVRNQVIPLPPLAEQKRIVAAIEQLLPLCEKLGE